MGQTSGSNTGSLELLKKIEEQQRKIEILKTKLDENFALSHITPANFFESTETVELIEMEVVKTGMAISLYARIKILSELINNQIGTIKEPYRPHLKEAVGSIRSATAPYKEVGSIWFGDTGAVRIYGNEIQTQYYINATWLYLID